MRLAFVLVFPVFGNCRPTLMWLVMASLLPGLLSCGRMGEREEITETREISTLARKPLAGIADASRFFAEEKPQAEGESQHPLLWKSPEGWQAKPTTQMRLIDFSFGPQGEGECYLSALPGAAGGLSANLNRWRSQMGASALSDEQIEKLPRKNFLGAAAHFMEVEGDFRGMGDAANSRKGYKLIGLIHQAPELTLFIKMTGPKALVEANAAAFEQFCQSVQFRAKAQGAEAP